MSRNKKRSEQQRRRTLSMHAADVMQMTSKRKASVEPAVDETTAMLAAVAWEREQEDRPLRLDEDQEVLEHDFEDEAMMHGRSTLSCFRQGMATRCGG